MSLSLSLSLSFQVAGHPGGALLDYRDYHEEIYRIKSTDPITWLAHRSEIYTHSLIHSFIHSFMITNLAVEHEVIRSRMHLFIHAL